MKQLAELYSGENNLVPFYLGWREFILKPERKYTNILSNIVWNFLLLALKMLGNSKTIILFVEKVKSLHCHAII